MPSILPEPIMTWIGILGILFSSFWYLAGDGISDSDLAISIREGREFRAEVRLLIGDLSDRIGDLEDRVAESESKAKR